MIQRMTSNRTQIAVIGKLIERVRHEHKLTTATLALLSGVTNAQVKAIEEGRDEAFVDHAHRIDCARRIAVAMGLPENHFLQIKKAVADKHDVVNQAALSSSPDSLPREVWEHLPVAGLKILASLRTTDYPRAPEQRRQSSPLLIALIVSLVLTALMLGLAWVD